MDAPDLASFSSSSPLVTALAALALAWAVMNYMVRGPTGLRTGGTHDSAREDAVRAARERQQRQLAEAAELRAGRGSSAQALPPAPKPDADAADKPAMPARMVAAMKRREEQAGGESSCGCEPPVVDVPAPGPSTLAASKRRADDPNSVTQRLARIERGKGPSDHNPLHGHASGSTAGSSFQCKKKGG